MELMIQESELLVNPFENIMEVATVSIRLIVQRFSQPDAVTVYAPSHINQYRR